MRILVVSTSVLACAMLLAGSSAAVPPELASPSIDAAPPAVTNSQTARFEFSSPDVGVAFSCSLNGVPFSTCTSPQTYESLVEGAHTFAVKTSSALEESSPATHSWTIDLTAPNTSITASPNDPSNDANPSFSFSSSEAATFECQMDAAGWSSCTSPKIYSSLAAGSHTFEVRATDTAGNLDSSPATYTWTIDLTAPNTSITASPADPSNDANPSFSFSSSEAGTFECKLDAGSFASCTSPKSYSGLAAGAHTFEVRASNAAGNTDASPATHNWLIDLAPPVFVGVGANQVVEQTSPAGAVASYGVPLADDRDPAPKLECSPPSGGVFPAGVTTVSCRATDWAGNSAETQFTVTVANTIRPRPVQGLRALAANRRVTVGWTTPVDWDYDRLVVRRSPRATSTWRVVHEGRSATSFVDRNVQNDTEYVYEATVYDTAGNASASVSTQARPSALLSPRWNATLKRPPTLRWAANRKAAYYNVQLWRNGRKILSRWPTRPSFGLARTWRQSGRRYSLTEGTYFVYAWPGFGPKAAARYGRLIGWTKFRVD